MRAAGDQGATRQLQYSNEDLMRYLDGELPADEAVKFDRVLAGSTELQRELALYRALKQNLQGISFSPALTSGSIWDRVSVRLARPFGWLFMVAGASLWAIYGGYIYLQSSINAWEKLATSAVISGILILFATIVWERYRAWQVDPYKGVHR